MELSALGERRAEVTHVTNRDRSLGQAA